MCCMWLVCLQDIYQWRGSECNRFETVKASQVAIDIRDNERNGRAKLHMAEEGAEPQEIIDVRKNPLVSVMHTLL